MTGIFDTDVKVFPSEILFHLECIPFFWNSRCDSDSVQVRTETENAFHTTDHYCRGCSCQPVYMRTSKVYTCTTFSKLSVTVRFQLTDLRTVILGGRCVLFKICKGTISVSAERFGKYKPAL